MTSQEKIALILRTDKDTIGTIEKVLEGVTGKKGVMDKIAEENETAIKEKLDAMGLTVNQARDIYASLLTRISQDDKKLFEVLDSPICLTPIGCASLFDAAHKSAKLGKGFFLKEEKARELLIKTPPQKIMELLGYRDINQLLQEEDLFEIFSALRFMEDANWLNDVFFKQYEDLTPSDFEERETRTIVLSARWRDVAEKFLKKKYHNISHLKELGVIFVLPAVLKIQGETLRTIALVLHYLHEIDFYSKLFRKFASEKNFSERLISSLKGDVLDERFDPSDLGKKWMIVQRYLAKDDKNDWRLLEPHINPEAIHWKKAENDIGGLGKVLGNNVDLSFWKDLDVVGGFYPTNTGIDVLVSFNFVDTVMALVMKKEMVKYLYHHQEALWNKIFYEYFGEEKMEQLTLDNWGKGYIEL